ncbi:MAG TPA: VWA domain-containing protein, partial [Chthoniobacterales bacterium]|nr:VWA domain-containing protein [Chthoniobacterales bacterium]
RGVVDLRRTIRLSLGSGGDPINLSYKKQKRQRAKLVVLLDVSDSMNPYSAFLLKFTYVLKRYFREVVSFIFSTSLIEISEILKAQRWSDALRVLSQMTTGWSGGTRIGGSLKEFNRHYSGKLLSPETVLLILSDGWDTEGPETLITELRKIKRRIGKLIWLNPLLGQEGYEPVTRAMNAALPYIDVFASAHNLESLLELERHLIKA